MGNNKTKKRIIILGSLVLVAVALFLYLYFQMSSKVNQVAEDQFYNHIIVEGIDLSGKTKVQAREMLDSKLQEMRKNSLWLKGKSAEIEITLDELGLHWLDIDAVLEEAVSYGKTGSLWERYQNVRKLEDHNLQLDLLCAVDEDAAKAVVEKVAQEINVEPQNAVIEFSEGKFSVTEDVAGEMVDVSASVELIEAQANAFEQTEIIDLATNVTEAHITGDMLSQVEDKLGACQTTYTDGNNRSKNIRIATGRINGTVLLPGEEFSTSDTMGSRNAENGYLKAGAYLNGEVIDSYGGGVCQVSTTLYNAVLEAELEVTERHEHSMIVDYVSAAKDAAIAEGSKDFKFKNNTGAPIYIYGYAGNGKVSFVIYGAEERSEGRTVEYRSEVLSTKEKSQVYRANGELSLGTIQKKSSGHTGKKAQLWKIVYENGEEVSREKVNDSSYMMSPDYFEVGTASSDKEASALVKSAVSSQDRGRIDSAIAEAKALIKKKAEEAAAEAAEEAAGEEEKELYENR